MVLAPRKFNSDLLINKNVVFGFLYSCFLLFSSSGSFLAYVPGLAKSSVTYSARTTPSPPPLYRLHPQPLLALPLHPLHPLHQPSNLAYQPVKILDSSNNLRFESRGFYHNISRNVGSTPYTLIPKSLSYPIGNKARGNSGENKVINMPDAPPLLFILMVIPPTDV